MSKQRIALFASGTGSNAINLIRFFKNHETIEVVFVLSNKIDAPVLNSAQELGVPSFYKSNEEVSSGKLLIDFCEEYKIDWVILVGYLRLIPSTFIDRFKDKMINLHPSLLPNYGGKGMYGHFVHEAVVANKETESGITIHYVNSEFDKGRIIAQFRCAVSPKDTPADVASKIHVLEQSYLPIVIEKTILIHI